MQRPRVYLAGPDVFLPDAPAWFARKKAVCAAHGLEGVSPLDAERDVEAATEAMGIALGNEALIRSCRAVIANLTPFRGPDADAGTAYELGYARALGLALFAYSTAGEDYATRCRNQAGAAAREGPEGWRDAEGLLIEAFGLCDNLMLDCAVLASGGVVIAEARPAGARWSDLTLFEACAARAARALGATPASPGG